MEQYSLEIIAAILASIIVTLIAYIMTFKLRESRYNIELKKMELEIMRSSLEKKIYDLNDKLVTTEERWKDLNHLIIGNKSYQINDLKSETRINLSNFLRSNGISENDLVPERGFIFVLTPFHSRFDEDFQTIKSVCHGVGLKCLRGDETFIESDIFPMMLKYILKSDFIIANITGRNPNVLYELGIAQALDKNVLLISKNPKELPIDIKSRKFVIYNDPIELKDKLKDALLQLMLTNKS